MKEAQLSTTKGNTLRYQLEGVDGGTVEAKLTDRDWDVRDAEARAEAFERIVGEPVDEWWEKHAQWFIHAERNAAALLLYRFKTPRNVAEWGRREVSVP